MRTIRLIRSAPVLCGCGLAVAACGGGGGEEEAGVAAADLVGYYSYADPARGTSHLALLQENRFLLVQEPPEAAGVPGAGAGPVEGAAEGPPVAAPEAVTAGDYGGGSAGAVGWYIIQGDSLYLNGERLYARGLVTPELLRLVFVDPLVAGAGGEEYEMPFKKVTADARPGDQQGQGGGSGDGGGEQGGGGGEQGG